MSQRDDIVYLDYAATTPADPRVVATMTGLAGSDGDFANPSAVHVAGRRSSEHVQRAARQLGALLNVSADCLLWTSGATESNNLAITGAARARASQGRHLITMPVEHKAVTDVFTALERDGFEVTWLAPGTDGRLDLDDLAAAIRDDTQLVSIMHVNNETGIVQDIAAIGALCRDRDVLYHVDAAQSAGKLPLDLAALPVDMLSMSAHKFYGPKGIGALYIADRPNCHIAPLFFGGSQQRRLRPGTLPVPLIAGFGVAAEIAQDALERDISQLTSLRDRLWDGIRDIDGVILNGSLEHGFPGILNISIGDIEGESLLLDLEPLCVATGSACNSQSAEPSFVLRALGRSDREAQSAIRFSVGRDTAAADIDFAVDRYTAAVDRLRAIAPERRE